MASNVRIRARTATGQLASSKQVAWTSISIRAFHSDQDQEHDPEDDNVDSVLPSEDGTDGIDFSD